MQFCSIINSGYEIFSKSSSYFVLFELFHDTLTYFHKNFQKQWDLMWITFQIQWTLLIQTLGGGEGGATSEKWNKMVAAIVKQNYV